MSKIKYDVSDVEDTDFDTVVPPDLYKARIDSVTEKVAKSSGNDMLEIVYLITHGKFKGRKIWDYVVLSDATAWKLKQLVKALGKNAKGELDTKKITGSTVQIRTKTQGSEDDEYGIQARIKTVLPASGAKAEADDDEDEAEAEAETKAKAPKGDNGDDDDEGSGEEFTWDDLQDYDRDDLKEVIEDEDLDIKVGRKSEDKLRVEIAEALGIEEGGEDDEDDDEDEDEGSDYSSMKMDELRSELKERGLSRKGSKPKLVSRLEEDDEDDDGEPF